MPVHVSSTCAHHKEVKIALHSLWYHHTCSCLDMFRAHVLIIRRSKMHYTAYSIITPIGVNRCDDTRGCVMQFWPPDVEHMCPKHVEAWNKLTVKQKFCASSWLITEINILRCTVSKTLKKPNLFVYENKAESFKVCMLRREVFTTRFDLNP